MNEKLVPYLRSQKTLIHKVFGPMTILHIQKDGFTAVGRRGQSFHFLYSELEKDFLPGTLKKRREFLFLKKIKSIADKEQHDSNHGQIEQIERDILNLFLHEIDRNIDDLEDRIQRDEKDMQEFWNDYQYIEDFQILRDKKIRNMGRISFQYGIRHEPYFARMDFEVSDDNECLDEIFYIGRKGFVDEGNVYIVDWRSDVGQTFYQKNITEFNIKGFRYRLSLRRRLHIQDSVLMDVFTEYKRDSMYRADSTVDSALLDPFLIEVVNDKRRQHNLTDIIQTIQAKQIEIIRKPININVIVQGCAGSGKTMVLLHRLSYAVFNNRNYNLDRIKIITPNKSFGDFISELSRTLELGKIKRITAEQYYSDLISQYKKELVTKEMEIIPEPDENHLDSVEMVSYVYSEQFRVNMKNYVEEYFQEQEKKILREYDMNKVFGDFGVNLPKKQLKSLPYQYHSELVIALEKTKKKNIELRQELDRVKSEIKKCLRFDKNGKNLVTRILDISDEQLMENLIKNLDYAHSILATRVQNIGQSLKQEEFKCNGLETLIQNLENDGVSIDYTTIKDSSEEVNSWIKSLQKIENRLSEYNNSIGFNLIIKRRLLRQSKRLHQNLLDYCRKLYIEAEQKKIMYEQQKKTLYELEEIRPELERQESMRRKLAEDVKGIEQCREGVDKWELSMRIDPFYSNVFPRLFPNGCDLSPNLKNHIPRYQLYMQILLHYLYYGPLKNPDRWLNIDEAQDFSYWELRLLKDVLGENCVFNLYGDTKQITYPYRNIENWDKVGKMMKCEKFILNENYRNTVPITEYVNLKLNQQMVPIGLKGPDVYIGTMSLSLAKTISHVKNHPEERYAVIYSESYTNIEKIKEKFRHNKIDVNTEKQKWGREKVSVLTVGESKGLEFECVMAITNGMADNEKYITFTRALQTLIISDDLASPMTHL